MDQCQKSQSGRKNSKRTLENTDISPNKPDPKINKTLSEGSTINKTVMDELIKELQETLKNLTLEVSELKTSNATLSQNVSGLTAKLDQQTKGRDEHFTNLENRLIYLETENSILREHVRDIHDKVADLEYHQKRNNLIFEGFPERKNESGEDIFNELLKCFESFMDTQHLKTARCHRLGPKRVGENRAIIANFPWFGDVTTILENKKKLPKGIFVKTDLPKRWDENSRLLRPWFKALRDNTDLTYHDLKLTKGKLIVQDQVYAPSSTQELNEKFPNIHPCEKSNADTIAFFGPASIYSNMNLTTFRVDNVMYRSSEHYIQHHKAKLFDDDISAVKILATHSPFEAKKLGDRVKNYAESKWHSTAKQIAVQAVFHKFAQNESLSSALMSTSKTIVEASMDSFWGTGVALRNSMCLNNSSWRSKGIMSEMFDVVRDKLQSLPPPESTS